jgi:hypothetical protein
MSTGAVPLVSKGLLSAEEASGELFRGVVSAVREGLCRKKRSHGRFLSRENGKVLVCPAGVE